MRKLLLLNIGRQLPWARAEASTKLQHQTAGLCEDLPGVQATQRLDLMSMVGYALVQFDQETGWKTCMEVPQIVTPVWYGSRCLELMILV